MRDGHGKDALQLQLQADRLRHAVRPTAPVGSDILPQSDLLGQRGIVWGTKS